MTDNSSSTDLPSFDQLYSSPEKSIDTGTVVVNLNDGVKNGKNPVKKVRDKVSMSSSRSSLGEFNEMDPEPVGEWSTLRTKRDTWPGNFDFILSCIGYAVGLGNIWRFPYLCYKNGGGAFLVPYIIFLILFGIPLTMLEMSMGQFSSLGVTGLFQKFCPFFQGLGWGQVFISGITCIYYNVIITWTVYYLYLSVQKELPWASCGNWWNTDNCVDGIGGLLQNTTNMTNGTILGKRQTASEQFWKNNVLDISDGIDDLGELRYELVIALFVAWVLIFACLFNGVKTSGRVVYVTATFPYLVMVILFFRGITLPGAIDGILYYMVPKWERLLESKVWIAAASQIFYSVGASWGTMITFASFNRFKNNVYRDAIVIPAINCCTSIFAGLVVFSIIGYMAQMSGQDVDSVITSGPGLAFIVYPEAVASFPVSPLWAVLFFLMLLTIGVDSQFGMFETMITAFVDTWPHLLRKKRKIAFTGFCCFVMFLMGLLIVTRGGMYILQMMDWYCATFSLMVIGSIECLLVSWNYGVRRFMLDMQLMTNRTPSFLFAIAWSVVTPALVILLLIASLIYHTPVKYGDYDYPQWAIAIGWCIASVSLIPIPYFMMVNMMKVDGSFYERLVQCMRPTPDWGPSRMVDRVAFRKSFAQVPSPQLYVQGVERHEIEIVAMSDNRPSCVHLDKLCEEAHFKNESKIGVTHSK